jgi:hypothetical protein
MEKGDRPSWIGDVEQYLVWLFGGGGRINFIKRRLKDDVEYVAKNPREISGCLFGLVQATLGFVFRKK